MKIHPKLLHNYWIETAGLTVTNPANEEIIGTVKDYSIEETKTIIAAANDAMARWSGKTAKARASILLRWRDLILENKDALASIISTECGKPLFEAKGEVSYGASFLEWFAEEGKRLYGDIIPSHAPDKRILVLKQAIGVSAAITPWNFPLAMITRKAGPALAAGCPMIVKPAEATPLSALAIEALAYQAGIPEDIFKIITTTNPDEIGKTFCASPIVRKLSFTGSTKIGKLLAKQCGDTVKKISLELGGNAPFIVFEDADIDAAVKGAVLSKYRNAGQTCICTNRILVHHRIHDEFVEKLVNSVKKFKTGPDLDNIDIGPLINIEAKNKVSKLVNSAIDIGATALTGGISHEAGPNFFTPTVLTNVTPEMDIVNNEIFGPVAPVIQFTEEKEAIAIANNTPYGLAAYFYTTNMARIWRVMEALEYGMVGVNEGMISTESAPFGGVKESGIGREGSRYGIDEYTEMKYCLLGGLGGGLGD